MNAVNEMAKTYDMPILYSCHPRSEKMIEKEVSSLIEELFNINPLVSLIIINFNRMLSV